MDERLMQLFLRYLQGHSNPAEVEQVMALLRSDGHDDEWKAAIAQFSVAVMDGNTEASLSPDQSERLQQRLLTSIAEPVSLKPRFNWSYAAAAILLVALATALYFSSGIFVNRTSKIVNDIAPGYNQATLTLADGTKVALDSAQSGIIINAQTIKYNNGNSVLAEKGRGPRAPGTYNAERTTYNSLTTPKGGQYQIILQDGTKVWLNSASTLKYPSRFSGATREVFLEGEAFFEVNNNLSIGAMQANRKSYLVNRKSNKPFVVRSQNQEITVLGTGFNVTAFADEKEMKTTLVEGKVQVRSQNVKRKTYNVQLLSPAQQARVKGDSLTVSRVDVNRETAWLYGLFNFQGQTFDAMMRQIGRWYNVDIVYGGKVPTKTFGGKLSRGVNLSVLVDFFKQSGIPLRVEGRKLIIENN